MLPDYAKAHQEEIASLVNQALPTVAWEAAHELARRNGVTVAYSLADSMPAGDTWLGQEGDREAEMAYRRGYYHGYSAAMDALQPACKASAWTKLAHFFDGALYRWRHGEPPGFVPPPGPGRN